MTHQRNEGRQHAIETIQAVINMHPAMFDERGPLGTVIANLEQAAERMPPDYAAGIREILKEVNDAKFAMV